MSDTRAKGIFEQLKTFLSPVNIWEKVLVPQYTIFKKFGTPTTKLNIAQKVFILLSQLYNSFCTPEIEQQQKNSKFLITFLSYELILFN